MPERAASAKPPAIATEPVADLCIAIIRATAKAEDIQRILDEQLALTGDPSPGLFSAAELYEEIIQAREAELLRRGERCD